MRSGQLVHIVPLAIGGFIAMKAGSVPRGDSPLDITDRITREISWFWSRSAATGREDDEDKQEQRGEARNPGAWRIVRHTD